MTTRSEAEPTARAHPPSRRIRWLGHAGQAAAAWSLGYGLLGLYWTFGGAGFPFGTAYDAGARWTSLLEHATPGTIGPVITAVGLGGAAFALLISRGDPPRRPRRVLVGLAWTLAAALAVVVPDYRPLLATVRLPMLLVGAPFGWPREVGLTDFFSLYLPWPVVNQFLLILGGLLWAATAVAYQRRSGHACFHCGRTSANAGWTTAASAARWGRYAAYVAIAVPVGYALTRWSFALDVPIGVSRKGIRRVGRENPGIWLAGAMLATMGAGGAVLTLGLIQRWGEVYPRWIPHLRGKPVRPRTAVIPASLAALLVTSAGLMYVRHLILGRFELTTQTWGLYVPELFWPLWGVALGAAAIAYHLRRRGECDSCART